MNRFPHLKRRKTAASSVKVAAELAESGYRPCIASDEVDPFHTVFPQIVARCSESPGCKVLEIGSRQVTGVSRRELFADSVEYLGFDVHHGPGVDVTGDAHELASYFQDASMDAILSISVFEHLAFPWKVAMEINRVLKPGGVCYVSTHPCWPTHELPWDFWRFPLAGLRLLFSEPTGFRVTVGL